MIRQLNPKIYSHHYRIRNKIENLNIFVFKVGEMSETVDTDSGVHIILRTKWSYSWQQLKNLDWFNYSIWYVKPVYVMPKIFKWSLLIWIITEFKKVHEYVPDITQKFINHWRNLIFSHELVAQGFEMRFAVVVSQKSSKLEQNLHDSLKQHIKLFRFLFNL